jgi:hypothetical protein
MVIPGVPAISVFIMRKNLDLPDTPMRLREDAMGLVIGNTENAAACKIRISPVPLKIENKWETLAPVTLSESPQRA